MKIKNFAIAIFDIPECCAKCPCSSFEGTYYKCQLTNNSIIHSKAWECIEDFCPLHKTDIQLEVSNE